MPIGTSDGRNFNDEFEYAASQLAAKDNEMAADEISNGPQGYPNFKQMGLSLNQKVLEQLPQSTNIEDRTNQTMPFDLPYGVPAAANVYSGEAPITTENTPLKITVTPRRPIEDKPMNEPFVDDKERRTVIDKLLGLTGDRYQLWPEKAARTLLDAFKLPGDVAQGKADPSSPQSIGRAAELAGAVIFGPAPVAKAAVDGTLGSIAGITAKTADKEMLSVAKVLDRRGYTSDEIFQTSGWFKGFDGQWKHEIPTTNAMPSVVTDKLIHGEQYDLKDFLHFPELFKAYPELKNVPVKINNETENLGVFHPDKNLIEIKSAGQSENAITDTVLHEVQHWIQAKEGFDYGNNPQAAVRDLVQALNEKLKYAKTPEDIARIQSLIRGNLQNTKKIGDEIYVGSPGEREARLVELRRQQSPEFNKEVSPVTHQRYLDETIPESYEVRMPWEKPPITVDKMASVPLQEISKETNPTKLNFRLGQLLRDKAATKKAGGDVDSSDYSHYNTQIRAIRDRLKELK